MVKICIARMVGVGGGGSVSPLNKCNYELDLCYVFKLCHLTLRLLHAQFEKLSTEFNLNYKLNQIKNSLCWVDAILQNMVSIVFICSKVLV